MGYRFIHVNLELGPNHLIEVEIRKECFVWLMTYAEFENMKAERQFTHWGGYYTFSGFSGLVNLRIPHQDNWRCVVTRKDREPEVIVPQFNVYHWQQNQCQACGGRGQVTSRTIQCVKTLERNLSNLTCLDRTDAAPGYYWETRFLPQTKTVVCSACSGSGGFAGWNRCPSFVYP